MLIIGNPLDECMFSDDRTSHEVVSNIIENKKEHIKKGVLLMHLQGVEPWTNHCR